MTYLSNIFAYENINFIFLLVLVFISGWFLRKLYQAFLFILLKLRGKYGETKAINLLKINGYQILEKQLTLKGRLFENKKLQAFTIRPDYLVKKNNDIFIAEVKTGKSASINNISTRRQLLEYSKIYNSKKIILVDINNASIKLIEFL
tara:strand:- start:79 stop:522 length:444 start_codon:yes stop_codon:yes gene_type:complete